MANSSDGGGGKEVSNKVIVNSIVLEVDMGDAPPGTTLDLFIKPAFKVVCVAATLPLLCFRTEVAEFLFSNGPKH